MDSKKASVKSHSRDGVKLRVSRRSEDAEAGGAWFGSHHLFWFISLLGAVPAVGPAICLGLPRATAAGLVAGVGG